LRKIVDADIKAGKSIHAIALIHHNLETILANIDAQEVVPLTAILLENNHWQSAKHIFETAQVEASKSATSNISFEFAKFFMQRKDWQSALEYLNDISNELSPENANYAYLMTGTILQHQKDHRGSIKHYKKINPSSKYYPSAVLNTAIAYIRQDWWTDAHIVINDTITKHNKHLSHLMADRLNLVLGYALLRKEFFRNSRDAFRNVSLTSPYTNKALLGIALSAVNQDDFIGALNAIKILKDKKTTDLSVDESYLLLPYTYGKLKQNLTATSAYNVAITYYQERISRIEEIIRMDENLLRMTKISLTENTIRIRSNEFDYSSQYPGSFFDNYIRLLAMEKTASKLPEKLRQQYDRLYSDNKISLKNINLQLLLQRKEYLQSYLNQARYGLARIFDNSLATN
ncbi:MAG: hypothetical protein OEZ47_17585, partial [Gammaproteobacteria bacterium]|nr:hypothetical protein [Gammaproteobacteria bacterium]